MPQNERVRVLRGELKKTSGGLVAADLVRNKRGKVVSKKKSNQAAGANNLGSWLRSKGDKFQGKPRGFKGVEPKPAEPQKKAAKAKKVQPMKAGEKVDHAKVSVGNIVNDKMLKLSRDKKKRVYALKKDGMNKSQIKKIIDKWWKEEVAKINK